MTREGDLSRMLTPSKTRSEELFADLTESTQLNSAVPAGRRLKSYQRAAAVHHRRVDKHDAGCALPLAISLLGDETSTDTIPVGLVRLR